MSAEAVAAIETRLGRDWRRLAEAFRARPLGPHDPALQWLLVLMRRADNGLNLVLVQTAPTRWVLAERRAEGPPMVRVGMAFGSLADAERTAFRLRWQALTGIALSDADGQWS